MLFVKVLITCDKENIASARTIINNGAKLENEIQDGNRISQRSKRPSYRI